MINALPHTASEHAISPQHKVSDDKGQKPGSEHFLFTDAVSKRPGPAPRIKVVFEEDNHGGAHKGHEPDFVINKQGKIEVRNDFEKHPHPDGQIVIRVDRAANQMNPTELEQKGLSHLVTYLNGRLQQDYPDSRHHKLNMSDNQGLVDEKLKHQVAQEPHWDVPAQTRHQIQHVNRFEGGEGTMSHRDLDGYFPRREVPRAADESLSVSAMKDAIASLFAPEKSHPYETVRHKSDGGFAVGRYGLGENLISSWLADLLGDPPDWGKLDELAAKGLVPKDFAKHMHDPKFRQEFGQFVTKLKGGHGEVSPQELNKFLPKELQETIATERVTRIANGGEKDPGKIALAMMLDKNPNRLSATELADEGDKQYMGAARRLFGLAQAREMTGPNDRIEWFGTSPMGAKIAQVAEHTARSMDTVGWCARGVETALGKLGIHFSGNAADTRGFFEHDSRFKRVSMNDLQPGDVVVRGASRSHGYGHIFVYLGNGMEASDHVQALTNGSRYGQSVAFRFVGDEQNRST